MQKKFPLAMRLIHWAMALLILGMIALGWWMGGLDREDPIRMDVYNLHKSFGVLALALLALRFLVRLASSFPDLPEGLATAEKILAKLVHFLLYALMLAVPVSGIVMSGAAGYGVKFFGWPLPLDFLPQDKALSGIAHGIHEISPYVLLGFVALHVAGALKHRFFDREHDVLGRMI